MFPSNVKYYNTFTRYLNIFNLLFSFQAYNFFHTPLLRSTSFSSAWSRTDIIVTYLVPSFPRQIAIDRDPARVGTLRLKLRYPFDPAEGSIVVSISFLYLFPLTRGYTSRFCVVVDRAPFSYWKSRWISLPGRAALNDSDDRPGNRSWSLDYSRIPIGVR